MPTPHDDIELMNQLKNGDISAFDHLYTLYFRQLRYFAFKITGDADAARDHAVDAFVKILHRLPDFNSISGLKSYLFTTVRNACVDHLRSQKRHEASHDEIRYLAETEENIELAFFRSEALAAIYDEIEQLPPQCRQIVRLTFIEGRSVNEIASEMNLAQQTVLNQKSRGIRLVRTALIKSRLLSFAPLWVGLEWLSM